MRSQWQKQKEMGNYKVLIDEDALDSCRLRQVATSESLLTSGTGHTTPVAKIFIHITHYVYNVSKYPGCGISVHSRNVNQATTKRRQPLQTSFCLSSKRDVVSDSDAAVLLACKMLLRWRRRSPVAPEESAIPASSEDIETPIHRPPQVVKSRRSPGSVEREMPEFQQIIPSFLCSHPWPALQHIYPRRQRHFAAMNLRQTAKPPSWLTPVTRHYGVKEKLGHASAAVSHHDVYSKPFPCTLNNTSHLKSSGEILLRTSVNKATRKTF